MTARRYWTAEEIETAERLVERGATVAEIAARMGRSPRATESAMFRRGIDTGRNRPWTGREIMALREMVARRLPRKEIARRLGRSPGAVNHQVFKQRLSAPTGAGRPCRS